MLPRVGGPVVGVLSHCGFLAVAAAEDASGA